MLKKTITYTNYLGENTSKECHFNLTTVELTRMQAKAGGDLSAYLTKIVKEKDMVAILKFVEDLVYSSYGEISADGERFMKSDEISLGFTQTPAYEALFEDLASSEDALVTFVQGVLPAKLRKQTDK